MFAVTIDEPSDDTVRHVLSSSWPTFLPLPQQLMEDDVGVIWGNTSKSSSSEIHLNPDLITALENASEDSDMHVILLTILVVTALHEGCRHLTKLLFNCEITPPGCGPETSGSIYGESGVLLEEFLIGGIVSVLWREGEEGDMDKILGLVLEYRGRFRKLTLDHCRAFLASIKSSELKALPFGRLPVHKEQKGVGRHSLISAPTVEDSKFANFTLPKGVVMCRGLGFRDIDRDILS